MHYETYIFVLITCVVQIRGLYEGDSCTAKGSKGVCKNINYCPSAIEDVSRKIMPVICTYGVKDPIVCCVTTASPLTTEQPRRVTTTTTEYVPSYYEYESSDDDDATCPPLDPSRTKPKTGQKAWDKCIEYQDQYLYPCVTSYTGVGGATRSSNCNHGANKYIVGGTPAEAAEFPHMALLGYQPAGDDTITFSCGGSVISEEFIMTAGHCIHGGRLGPVSYALLGTLRRSDKYEPSNLYTIKEIIKHPKYASPVKYNDLALLKTDRRIRMSSYVIPACLDVGREVIVRGVATGWGATAYAGSNADTLQKVNLTKFADAECRQWHKPARHMNAGFDPRTQICYGDKTQSKDTCGGDSGGPLQVTSGNFHCMYVVVGVTSFGRQCGHVGQPGVYTRVEEYVPWIESVVWP